MPRVSTHYGIQDSRISTVPVIQTAPFAITADAPTAIQAGALLTGVIMRSGATAGRTDTLPSAAAICEALGISTPCNFEFAVRNTSGQTITVAAGAGGTTQGTMTVATVVEKKFRIVVTNATPGSEAYQVQACAGVAY